MQDSLNLRAGEWVEVRSKEEILSTLDEKGRLEALPFMPEMFAFCGRRFRVNKRAHKTCDPVNGLEIRGMTRTVHLQGLRCDGSAHGGCQAGCLIYWKDAWLKRANEEDQRAAATISQPPPSPYAGGGCTDDDVLAATRESPLPAGTADPTYVCQATRVKDATYPLRWWNPRHYLEDLTSGNVHPSRMISTFCFSIYRSVTEAGLGFGSALRWIYDRFQALRGGVPYPSRRGKVLSGQRTPTATLDLQPGELVRVKSYSEILHTLDQEWKNRGLYFDAEMVPFCGGTFRVLRRVHRIINEKTGKMLAFKSDAVILEGVECQALYAQHRKFCPRAYYSYCREIWLERVVPSAPVRPSNGHELRIDTDRRHAIDMPSQAQV